MRVEADELHRLNVWLYENAERLAIQVHSHPTEAFHSDTDDAYPIVTTLGGLSLVVPDFARYGVRGPETALYRLSSAGWQGALTNRRSACTAPGRLTMAIPDYFQRNAVAISQVISGLDEQRLEARLADVCISVTIGPDGCRRRGLRHSPIFWFACWHGSIRR